MTGPTARGRLLILLVALLVLGGLAGGAVWRAADRAAARDRGRADGPRERPGPVSLADGGERRLVFRNMSWGPYRDTLASVPAGAPGGPRTVSGLRCLRFHAAGGTGICLQQAGGTVTVSHRAVVLDARLREVARHPVAGIPTRARVSPSGRFVAWTVFVGGDSYAGTAFSTRTSVLDLRSGRLEPTLEAFAVVRDGAPYRASDVNFWGVTFSRDDRHFYATLATGGRTHLVRGDLAKRSVTTLRTNVECPSLSPDETRIAFKKRVPGLPAEAPWRLHVLDLADLRDHPLAEARSVDDQAVWTDGHTLAYALPGDFGSDLYTVPADGTGTPRRFLTSALAPARLG
ncbi:TolB-like translocation protein [Streptomyces sp. NPDC101118]|uniref:TolB-like translocation protein n=1 Tax=Streptomyces sp. NPDC101118 TaxID=3366109 RepID=UPI00381690A0